MKRLTVLALLLVAGSLQAIGLRGLLADPAFELDAEQREAIEGLLEEQQRTRIDLRAEVERAELALEQALRKGDEAIGRQEKLVDKVAEARAALEKQHLRTRMKVRELLREEQKELFDARPPFPPRRAGMRAGPGEGRPCCPNGLPCPQPRNGRLRGMR